MRVCLSLCKQCRRTGECEQNSNYSYLSIRWRWVVSLMLWPLHTLGKSPWYPLKKRLGVPPTANLDVTENRKIAGPRWDHPATQLSHYIDSATKNTSLKCHLQLHRLSLQASSNSDLTCNRFSTNKCSVIIVVYHKWHYQNVVQAACSNNITQYTWTKNACSCVFSNSALVGM